MKPIIRWLRCVPVASVAVWLAAPALGAAPGEAPGFRLIWADEFDGDRVDPSKWSFQLGDGCDAGLCGWGNNELQWYRAENAVVADGLLTITARLESYRGAQYTSARLRTLGKFDFKYGRVEARMKPPSGSGLWPALWMLPSDWLYGDWAASGEIDIMEAVNVPTQIHGTIHYGGEWPNNASSGGVYVKGEGRRPVDFSEDFHVYALEWEPGRLRWFVDGQLYSTKTDWHSAGAPYPAPFDQRFHLLLNLAVGGNWPGPPEPDAVFPKSFVIDYIRVHQRTEEGPPRMSVVSVNLEERVLGGGLHNAAATVLVADESGSPVAAAKVTGTFSGDFQETQSAVTGTDGVAFFLSRDRRGPAADFQFCVDAATHPDLLYDPASNVRTCGKVSGERP